MKPIQRTCTLKCCREDKPDAKTILKSIESKSSMDPLCQDPNTSVLVRALQNRNLIQDEKHKKKCH